MRFVITYLLLSIISLSAFSQSGYRQRDAVIRMKERYGFEPTIIAIDNSRYVGIEYITRTDSIIMRNSSVILRKDLDYSPFFEAIGVDSFYMKTMDIKEMNVAAWKWRGAEYVVKLEVEFPRDLIRIKYRLYAVNSEREIRNERFSGEKSDYRAVAHDVANAIYKFLTGDEGIYRSQIVYSKQVGQAQELFIADFDGNNERQLTDNGSINILPTVSPDGEYIFYTSYMDGDPKLYMLTLKGGKIDLVSGRPGLNTAAAVSPDGKAIACVLTKDGNSEIYLLDRKGDIKKRLTRTWQIETSPTWSPDGRHIAFTSDRTGSPQVYIMDIDGLNLRRLTFQGGYNASPVWSPKGDRIAYVNRGSGFDICTIDVTGKDIHRLVELGNNESPSYSPDGNMLVFSSSRLGGNDLYIMNFMGDDMHKITGKGEYYNPVWLPQRK